MPLNVPATPEMAYALQVQLGTLTAMKEVLQKAMEKHGILAPDETAAFLAQCSVESGLLPRRESLDYAVDALLRTFPTRITPILANLYGRGPQGPAAQQAIANIVYAGRNGNGDRESKDGWNYRGGGLIQLTGKLAYAAAGQDLGIDLVGHPELITTPLVAAQTAAWYWKARGLTKVLRTLGIDAVSKAINLGNPTAFAAAFAQSARRDRYTNARPLMEKANG